MAHDEDDDDYYSSDEEEEERTGDETNEDEEYDDDEVHLEGIEEIEETGDNDSLDYDDSLEGGSMTGSFAGSSFAGSSFASKSAFSITTVRTDRSYFASDIAECMAELRRACVTDSTVEVVLAALQSVHDLSKGRFHAKVRLGSYGAAEHLVLLLQRWKMNDTIVIFSLKAMHEFSINDNNNKIQLGDQGMPNIIVELLERYRDNWPITCLCIQVGIDICNSKLSKLLPDYVTKKKTKKHKDHHHNHKNDHKEAKEHDVVGNQKESKAEIKEESKGEYNKEATKEETKEDKIITQESKENKENLVTFEEKELLSDEQTQPNISSISDSKDIKDHHIPLLDFKQKETKEIDESSYLAESKEGNIIPTHDSLTSVSLDNTMIDSLKLINYDEIVDNRARLRECKFNHWLGRLLRRVIKQHEQLSRDENNEYVILICSAISSMASDDLNSKILGEQNICESLAKLITLYDDISRQNAILWASIILTSDPLAGNKLRFGEQGFCKILIDLLHEIMRNPIKFTKFTGYNKFVENISWSLMNLVAGCPLNIELLRQVTYAEAVLENVMVINQIPYSAKTRIKKIHEKAYREYSDPNQVNEDSSNVDIYMTELPTIHEEKEAHQNTKENPIP